MAFDRGAVGRAFSEHRFDEALPHLAKDVRWTVVGYMVLEGADAVRRTCRETLEGLQDTTTTYERCVMAVDERVVAVDTLARYSGPNGVTTVASCDIYEYTGSRSWRSRRTPSRSTPSPQQRSRRRPSQVDLHTVAPPARV